MNPQNSTAILMVSFGTAISQARTEALEAIEHAVQHAYPQFRHCRAWTSASIREKVLAQDGIRISSPAEAIEQLAQDGIRNLIVQPVFLSDGIEYTKLKQELADIQSRTDSHDAALSITLGRPLLSEDCDVVSIVSAVMSDFNNLKDDELLVFMGHGTANYDDSIYVNLDAAFRKNDCPNVCLKTMRSASAVAEIISAAREHRVSRITLAPFMLTAGHHVLKDMAGEQDSSWKSQLERAGFSVTCIMKGLGQNPAVQNLFINKISLLLK